MPVSLIIVRNTMMSAITYRARLERQESLAYNVKSFHFRLVEPERLVFQPGQFVIVHVPKNGKTVKRAYSIASPPHEAGIVDFCIQHVEQGAASTYFWQLKEGDEVALSGPHGNFVLKQPVADPPIPVAAVLAPVAVLASAVACANEATRHGSSRTPI